MRDAQFCENSKNHYIVYFKQVALGSAGKDSSLRSDALLLPGEKAVLKNISLQREGYAIYMTLPLQPSWKLAEEGSESLSIMAQNQQVRPF